MSIDEAIKTGDLEQVKYLLEEKDNSDGIEFLNIAICHGQIDIIKYLIEEQNIDISKFRYTSNTPDGGTIDRIKYVKDFALNCSDKRIQEIAEYLESKGV